MAGVWTPVTRLGDLLAFSGRLVFSLRLTRARPRDVLDQTWRALRLAVLPVLMFMGPVGWTFGLSCDTLFSIFNIRPQGAGPAAVLIIRMFGAPFVAIVVAAVVGSAFAADIGGRKIRGELDASEVLGVSTMARLAVPRTLAIAIAGPVLTILGQVFALLNAYMLFVGVRRANPGAVMGTYVAMVDAEDPVQSVIKSIVLCLVLGISACYFGYQAEGGPSGVAIWVRRYVVFAIAAIFLLDWAISTLFFAMQ